MKKLIFAITIITLMISCTEKATPNFNINGKIIGFQKGTIFLEKFEADSIIVIDSIFINGTENFTFSENIKESDLFCISIDKSSIRNLTFYGEPGNINIETELNNFIAKAKITGSEQQGLLKEHDDYIKKIQFQNLDLIKDKFIAQKNGETDKIDEISNKYNQNLRRIQLFSINYAINHSEYNVAAFIAVSKINNTALKFKKQIYEALTVDVKNSKYGLLLKKELDLNL